jgi:NADP-dependent 3-hydroxy acid dehydrogenase YdfG
MSVVVITGASAGVGRATTRAFARRGDAVALIAREPERLEAARAEAVELGAAGAVACPLDVADADAVEAAAARIEEQLGPIDVWVNCAMAATLSFVHETDPADFRRVTEVTYLGQVHGTLAALRRMRARDRGVIIHVGSALAYRAIPLQATYCAAKHAVRAFADALRCELMHEGSSVHVTSVHLPGLNTTQFDWVRTTLARKPRPVAPVYQPELAADAIVWASEHPRREFFVGGSTVATILGNRLAPRIADRYLARTGIDGQQDEQPVESGRRDYLYEPLPGDRGAHGRFDDEATPRSPTWWLTRRRAPLAASLLSAAAAAALARSALRART